MERRQAWLFPVMVAAAGTVTGFGCLGIAAILGFMPLSDSEASSAKAAGTPTYYDALEQSSERLVAQVDLVEAQTAKSLPAPKRPGQTVR